MIQIQCRDCKRVIDYDEFKFNDSLTCRVCDGYFDIIDSEDDDSDEDYEDSELEDIEENILQGSIVDSPNLDQGVLRNTFDPEAKTKFD